MRITDDPQTRIKPVLGFLGVGCSTPHAYYVIIPLIVVYC